MSQERIPGGAAYRESELSQHEKQIRLLFRRAGWQELPTPEVRRQAVRDKFYSLFVEGMSENNSPHKVHNVYLRSTDNLTIAITRGNKIIAAKTTYDKEFSGQPNTIYSVVMKTPFWRRDLVFQLSEYLPINGVPQRSTLDIGYYAGKEYSDYIMSDN